MPTSSTTSWHDLTQVEQALRRVQSRIDRWYHDPRGGKRLQASIRAIRTWEIQQLEETARDSYSLTRQLEQVAEGRIFTFHLERKHLYDAFIRRSVSRERTAQLFGMKTDYTGNLSRTVVCAQVECLYRRFPDVVDSAEDEIWHGVISPSGWLDQAHSLTLDALVEDECLFIECLAAAVDRGEIDAGFHDHDLAVGAAGDDVLRGGDIPC